MIAGLLIGLSLGGIGIVGVFIFSGRAYEKGFEDGYQHYKDLDKMIKSLENIESTLVRR